MGGIEPLTEARKHKESPECRETVAGVPGFCLRYEGIWLTASTRLCQFRGHLPRDADPPGPTVGPASDAL